MSSAGPWSVPRLALVCVFVLSVAGCGGPENVGKVSGLVTLDGEPLPDALVQFEPLAGNSPSGGYTDASGNYSLKYNREVTGAEIGEHRVRISTHSLGDPDTTPPTPKTPEKVPAKYNKKTELRAKVQAGSNHVNFPLESSGSVGQPKSK